MLLFRYVNCCFILSMAIALASAQAESAIRLPKIIGDHMVLQAGQQAPIWGWAEPHERVTVQIGGQTADTTAGDSGKWSLRLESLSASPEPMTMTVRGSSGSTVTVNDIIVGEVWIGSGQSNMVMELPFDRRKDPLPAIRIFQVANNHSVAPLEDVEGQWVISTPETLAKFSWVLYEFGRNLHEALHVPVGLIQSTWGGTPIQGWTPASGFAGEPLLADGLTLINDANAEFERARKEFAVQRDAAAHSAVSDTAAVAEPQHPFSDPGDWPGHPTILYNAMIHPLAPYGVRGFLWYQGENNVFDSRPELYGRRSERVLRGLDLAR